MSYAQRWFYGPAFAAAEAKAALDSGADSRVVALYPPAGEPPIAIDEDGTDAAFIIVFRASEMPPVPDGMKAARANVGTMFLGSF
jgi:hypothetical protein